MRIQILFSTTAAHSRGIPGVGVLPFTLKTVGFSRLRRVDVSTPRLKIRKLFLHKITGYEVVVGRPKRLFDRITMVAVTASVVGPANVQIRSGLLLGLLSRLQDSQEFIDSLQHVANAVVNGS